MLDHTAWTEHSDTRVTPEEIRASDLWKDIQPVLNPLQIWFRKGGFVSPDTEERLEKWTDGAEKIRIWVR